MNMSKLSKIQTGRMTVLEYLRRTNDLTQIDLYVRSHVTAPDISVAERHRKRLNPEKTRSLAEALHYNGDPNDLYKQIKVYFDPEEIDHEW